MSLLLFISKVGIFITSSSSATLVFADTFEEGERTNKKIHIYFLRVGIYANNCKELETESEKTVKNTFKDFFVDIYINYYFKISFFLNNFAIFFKL